MPINNTTHSIDTADLLSAIIEGSDDAVVSKTLDGIIMSWNKGAEKIFGYKAEEIIGQPINILIPHNRQHEESEIQRKLRNGEKVDHFETIRLTKEGKQIDISVTISPIRNREGKFIGASKIARDITLQKEITRQIMDRKRVERTLSTEREILELVAKGADRDLVLTTLLIQIEKLSVQKILCMVMAVDKKERTLRPISGPNLPKDFINAMDNMPIGEHTGSCGRCAFEAKQVYSADIENDPTWAHARDLALTYGLKSSASSPIFSKDGTVIGTIAVYFKETNGILDTELMRSAAHLAGIVIERNKIETQLNESLLAEQAARAEAEKASRMKDEFLTTLSHELRTPLNSIVGWSQILRSDKNRNRLEEGLDIIARNGKAQAQIINDLLDMSRITSGKIRLDIEQIDLAELLQASIETIRPAAEAKAIRIVTLIEDKNCLISGDPNRIQQIFWNIFSNALKFTPKSGRIEIKLRRIDSQVEVRISDTGEGIPKDFLPYIFDRFRQSDATTTRKHGGLGIGLAIVKQLIELHGGTVSVSSEGLNKGSTFRLAFPVIFFSHVEKPVVGNNKTSTSPIVAFHTSLKGINALVIDDETDGRLLVQRLLEECFANVETAGSVEEAMQVLEHYKPDVIVSDIGMPNEDGFSFIAKLRKHKNQELKSVPALALTAYARNEDRMNSIRAGFDMHLSKPVDPNELITMISGLVRKKLID